MHMHDDTGPEEDLSIRSKRQQDKFLCYQVVYKRTVSNFSCPREQLRIQLDDVDAYYTMSTLHERVGTN